MNRKIQKSSLKDQMKELIKNKIVLAIAGIVFGIILIIHAAATLDALVTILGWVVLASAAVYFIRYFIRREDKNRSFVVIGIVLAAVGLLFVIRPDAIVNIFPIIMGIVLILGGTSDLLRSIGLSKAEVKGAVAFIIISILVIVLGILIMLHPGKVADMMATVMGISLLLNGVLDLILLALHRAD